MLEQAKDGQQKNSTREHLQRLRVSLLERKKRVDSDVNHDAGPIPANFSEQATAVENEETLVAIQGELDLQISQVNHALRRVESGDYGLCEGCGHEIGSARLGAIPMASLCFNCASLKS